MMIEFIKNLSGLELLVLSIAVVFVGKIIWREITVIRIYREIVKRQKERMKELEKNKFEGPHSWIDMEINGETTHVCKDGYFSPKNDAFVKEEAVKAHLHHIEYEKAKEKNRIKRLGEIASKHGISRDVIKDVYEDIINIRKDFDVQWLDKKLAEILSDKPNV